MEPTVDVLEAYASLDCMEGSETVQLGRLLKLNDAERLDEVALARRIAAGLPTSCVSALYELLGSSRVIGTVVSEATLRRHRKAGKPLSRRHSERIYELGRVLHALGRALHGDKRRMDAFLHRRHPLLDGATPYEMAVSCSAGADVVLNLVRRAEAGIAV